MDMGQEGYLMVIRLSNECMPISVISLRASSTNEINEYKNRNLSYTTYNLWVYVIPDIFSPP
jgi:hypothetical protein